jgi:general secretion pathway protein I
MTRHPSPAPRVPRDGAGFTLIEVMIALAIVSVALLAAMRALALSTDQQQQLHARSLALACADDRLAELSLAPPRSAGIPATRCQQGRSTFIVVTHLDRRGAGGWHARIDVRAATGETATGQHLAALDADLPVVTP